MHTFKNQPDRRRGTVLMVVMGMMAIGAIAVGSILSSTLGKMRLADQQVCLEQAFYIAQAGAERAATRIAEGNSISDTLTGDFGQGRYVTEVTHEEGSGAEFRITIVSTGTVKGQSRTITMRGVQRASWAQYCLFYNQDPIGLYIRQDEKFDGPVYSKPQLLFSYVSGTGQAEFRERAYSGATSISAQSGAKPVFHRGLVLKAKAETMASISFPELLSSAESEGLVIYGPSTIELDGSQMKITNDDKKWTKKVMPIPDNGVLYVGSTTRTTEEQVYSRGKWRTQTTTTTLIGDADVSAPKGFQGQLTIVADKNVNITDHIKYTSDPRYNPNSTDALGLIAQQNVVIGDTAPNNVNVFAHIIAVTGGFGVNSWTKNRGSLTVYGGIVGEKRNQVGTVSGNGYAKNYIFDKRFAKNPPPKYPRLTEHLEWLEWEG